MNDEPKALTVLDVQVAENKIMLWLSAGTVVAVLLSLIPAVPAVTVAMIPSVIVNLRGGAIAWRRLSDTRKRRAVAP